MLILLLMGIGFVSVVDELQGKITLGLMMFVMPIIVIYRCRDDFSSRVKLRIDTIGITDYRKNREGKIITWNEINEITLSNAKYMGSSAIPASLNIYSNDLKYTILVPIGVWDKSAKEIAEVIEQHIKHTAPHIYIDWSSEAMPKIQ